MSTGTTTTPTGTGNGAVAHAWYSSGAVAAVLVAALGLATAWLGSRQQTPENAATIKAGIELLQAGQAAIKADVARAPATVTPSPSPPVVVTTPPPDTVTRAQTDALAKRIADLAAVVESLAKAQGK